MCGVGMKTNNIRTPGNTPGETYCQALTVSLGSDSREVTVASRSKGTGANLAEINISH
jgi:hypothetical protein